MICFVGDGSYMMANSELATAVMRRIPFTILLRREGVGINHMA